MPFTRISLNQGKSPDYAHAVSAALHPGPGGGL